MSEHERFEIRFVDNEQRLYVLVSSDRLFHDACIIRDILRSERGGDWIILDARTGHCVADTRPREFPDAPVVVVSVPATETATCPSVHVHNTRIRSTPKRARPPLDVD